MLLRDPRVDRVAQILVNHSVGIKPGDLVAIRPDWGAIDLGVAVYEHVLRAGGTSFFQIVPHGVEEIFFAHATDEQLDFLSPLAVWVQDNMNVAIKLLGPTNTKSLSTVDPSRLTRSRAATTPLMQTFMRRQALPSDDPNYLRWTLTQHPTDAGAQDADMGLATYADFIYRASMVHLDDPVAWWREFDRQQQAIVDWLNGGRRQVHIEGANIDLTLGLEGRTWINASGKHNFPDGEVFTGPVEDSANGWVRYTYPAIYGGREVDGVELHFENGRVVSATATKGEEYLLSVLDTDAGSRILGELGIGTHVGIDRFTRNILFDEKMGGTCHLTLGAGYPNTGNNNESVVHWDMICDMRDGARMTFDNTVAYENGVFTIG